MPTINIFPPARKITACVLVLTAAGCSSSRAIEPATSSRPSSSPPTAVSPPPLRPVHNLIVIQARADSRHRIASASGAGPAFDARVEALARELAPEGVLERDTEISAVYETRDTPAMHRGGRQLVALRVGSGAAARVAVFSGDERVTVSRAYSPDGRPLGTAMIRYPVAHLRITSAFSSSRKNPVTKKYKPHLGVDFAAPFGTPVVAVADGEIALAKSSGSFGRLVRIIHDGEYESAYAHLQRFASGIKAGAHVIQGQVIGYVGNSGRATGPHLHFALLRDGKYIDPLAPTLQVSPRPTGDALVALRAEASYVEQTLAAADRENAVSTRLASARR